MWTKQHLIDEAYNELALQGFVFNLGPEMTQSALRRLDAMMATWDGRGIRIGYALPSSPASSVLDGESGIPDWANEAVFLALAIRLASGLGKTIAPGTAVAAKLAYDVVLARCAFPNEQQLPSNLPRGAGNKTYHGGYDRFFHPVTPLETVEGDSSIDIS